MAESPWSRRPVLPRATSFTRAGSRLRATACVSGAGVEPALPRISAWGLLPLGYSDVAPLSDRAGLTAWRGPAHDGASSAVRGPGAGTRRPRFTEPPPGVEPDLRPYGGRAAASARRHELPIVDSNHEPPGSEPGASAMLS